MTITLPSLKQARRQRAYTPGGEVGRRLAEAKALQHKIQELTAQLDVHRAWLLTHMNRLDLATIELGDFVVMRKTRHSWTYSANTEREMQALRVTQKWEQSQGIASDEPTIYVSMTTRSPKQ